MCLRPHRRPTHPGVRVRRVVKKSPSCNCGSLYGLEMRVGGNFGRCRDVTIQARASAGQDTAPGSVTGKRIAACRHLLRPCCTADGVAWRTGSGRFAMVALQDAAESLAALDPTCDAASYSTASCCRRLIQPARMGSNKCTGRSCDSMFLRIRGQDPEDSGIVSLLSRVAPIVTSARGKAPRHNRLRPG